MADTEPRHKLYVLEEGALTALASDEKFLKEFPFLRSLKSVPKAGCGTCGGSNNQRASAYTSAKAAIAGMGQDKKRKLKQMLSAKHVRVVYTTGSGKPTQLTF